MDGHDSADHTCVYCDEEIFGEEGGWHNTYGFETCDKSPTSFHEAHCYNRASGDDCEDCAPDGTASKITVHFNPFAHTMEENNEFIRRGYEVMPIRVPREDT